MLGDLLEALLYKPPPHAHDDAALEKRVSIVDRLTQICVVFLRWRLYVKCLGSSESAGHDNATSF